MGTLLHSRGTPFDKCFDELNLSNPAAVRGIHAEYLEAGAQILLTNTFGANRFKLAKHGLQDKLDAINRAGVELARQAAGRFGARGRRYRTSGGAHRALWSRPARAGARRLH